MTRLEEKKEEVLSLLQILSIKLENTDWEQIERVGEALRVAAEEEVKSKRSATHL